MRESLAGDCVAVVYIYGNRFGETHYLRHRSSSRPSARVHAPRTGNGQEMVAARASAADQQHRMAVSPGAFVCHAIRTNVGLYETTNYGKYELTGKGVLLARSGVRLSYPAARADGDCADAESARADHGRSVGHLSCRGSLPNRRLGICRSLGEGN
jgi:hypothetical protein